MPVTGIEAGAMMEITDTAGSNSTNKYPAAERPNGTLENQGADQVFDQIFLAVLSCNYPFLQEKGGHLTETGQTPAFGLAEMQAAGGAAAVRRPGAKALEIAQRLAAGESVMDGRDLTAGLPEFRQPENGDKRFIGMSFPGLLPETLRKPATLGVPAPAVPEKTESGNFYRWAGELSPAGIECPTRQEVLKPEVFLALMPEENQGEGPAVALQVVGIRESVNGCCGKIVSHSAFVTKVPEQAGAWPGSLPDQVIEPVVIQVQNMISMNRRKTGIQIQLSPARMGELTVKLSLEKGFLTAHFYTGNDTVKDILEASFSSLKEALAFHQLRLQEATVFLSDGGGGGNNQWFHGFLNRSCSREEAVSFSCLDNRVEEREVLQKEKSFMVDYLI